MAAQTDLLGLSSSEPSGTRRSQSRHRFGVTGGTSSVGVSRDEMNLAEFPLAVLSTRSDPKVKTLEFVDTKRLKDGELIERRWIITGADKFGLPTSTDDDVVLGLIRLSIDNGFRDRKIHFTRYELLKILRWSTEGRSYSRLVKSLDRLSGVRIRASNAFYDNATKSHQTCNFGIIDAYELNDGRNAAASGSDEKKSFFIWSEILFDSFRSGFIKKLDLDFYFTLKSAVSRRLYRFLDKHFYYRSSVEYSLMPFAFEKLGLSRNYKYASSIRQQLEPAAEELVKVGYLESFEFVGKGEATVVRFHQKVAARPPVENTLPTPSTTIADGENAQQRNTFIEALVSRGIHLAQAKRLLADKSTSELKQIDQILRYYDHLVETGDRKVSKNRVGFLYRAVESPFKFSVPLSFQRRSTEADGAKPEPRPQRPELRIFSASSERQNDHGQRVSRYQTFLQREIARRRNELGDNVEENIRRSVERNLSRLKPILGEERHREALEGCVRDELARKLGIPDLESWNT